MELKQYQKKVIRDITDYLYFYNQLNNPSKAYDEFWFKKGVNIGFSGVQKYQTNDIKAPQVCIKVPTGGGKTYIAASSVKPIFDFLPNNKKAVLWLVPSETILSQTINNLKNPDHPYRQKLNSDFSSRVEIYTKLEALNGQNFNTTTINEQLSIFVMSFDSFRIKNKEGRKVYQENSNLYSFSKEYDAKELYIDGADSTSLMQVFNYLNPVIIVDESHNATSSLSVEMLKNLNPSFVLDLTATPRKNSNVISYVDAMQLKKDHMVKLPVIVYNRPSQQQVIMDSIDLRNKLEKVAKENKIDNGAYIRPIVLFQAQPKTDDDNTTFEVLKEKLIKAGIPEEEIAIKTASINEIKNIDLLSPKTKIKYIITVNALKEGWDCPFAYILASLANRTSTVDVEQIVGRILRQPFTKKFDNNFLNMSYVLTSSNDFNNTLEKVISGLNSAGFSNKDYRSFDVSEEKKIEYGHIEDAGTMTVNESPSNEGFEFNPEEIKERITEDNDGMENDDLNKMLTQADTLNKNYEKEAEESEFGGLFGAEKEMLNVKNVNSKFSSIITDIKFPQFVVDVSANIFGETKTLVTKETLLNDFSLLDKHIPTSLSETKDQAVKVDLESTDSQDVKLTTRSVNERELAQFKKHLEQLPDERKKGLLAEAIYKNLEGMNNITATELKSFIKRIVNSLKVDELYAVKDNLYSVSYKIKQHIEELKNEYAYSTFENLLEKGIVRVSQDYEIPKSIAPVKSSSIIAKSFYEEESDDLNKTEIEIIRTIVGLDNIKSWHRIMERKPNEFYINGFINHYPDFWIITEKDNVIILEVKGEHLADESTKRKAKLGKMWQNKAGDQFRYFMVYKDKDMGFEGSYKLNDFIEILKSL